MFIKATTIGLFIKRLKIDALHPLEESAETEGKAIIHGMTVMRLREFAEKGYIPHGIVEQLIENHERKFKESVARTNADNNDRIAALTERVLNLYVLGLEREKLKELFTYGEMTEHVFRRIYGKLTIQAEAIERGDTPDEHVTRDARDIFENAAEFALKFLKRETAEKTAEEQILYYRAQSILAWKVVKELHKLEKEFESPIFTAERLGHTLATYERYRREAREKADAIRTRFPEIAQKLDKRLALRSTLRVEKKQLERLYRRGLLTPKLYIKLNEEYEREAGKLTGS